MFNLEEIRLYTVNRRGEEKELVPRADNRIEGIQSYLLYDRKGHVAGSLHALRAESLLYLYINIEYPVSSVCYEFPRQKGECLFLTAQLQAYISNKMYFVHVKSENDNAVINTAGQTYVSLTVPEDAQILIGSASTSDGLLRLLTRVVNQPVKASLDQIRSLKNGVKTG